MQARYYDPGIGRFLSIDPVGFTSARPDMFNRYAYAANDPVNKADPDGRSFVSCHGDTYDCKFQEPFGFPDIGSQQLGRNKGRSDKGERGRTGKADGTSNPDKKFKPGEEPGKRETKDQNGKTKIHPWPEDPRLGQGRSGAGVNPGSRYPDGTKVFGKNGLPLPQPGTEFSRAPGTETIAESEGGIPIEAVAVGAGVAVAVGTGVACALAEPCGAIAVAVILGGGAVGATVAQ